MAVRRQSSTYHLSAREGLDRQRDCAARSHRKLELCREASRRSKRCVEWIRLWADPEVPEGERDKLRRTFPEPLAGLRSAVA